MNFSANQWITQPQEFFQNKGTSHAPIPKLVSSIIVIFVATTIEIDFMAAEGPFFIGRLIRWSETELPLTAPVHVHTTLDRVPDSKAICLAKLNMPELLLEFGSSVALWAFGKR